MDEFLAKPIDPPALVRVLSRLGAPPRTPPAPAPASTTLLDEIQLGALVDALGAAHVASLAAALADEMDPHQRLLTSVAPGSDVTALRASAHALKGLAANFGLASLVALAGALEEAARAGDAAHFEKLTADLPGCADAS